MSRHEGVSCDSCMKGNFTGKRYKCLICYDYDLCASCYEAGTASSRHSPDHPMQCILTRADFDIFYGGESVSSDQHQSYTCPHCGRLGFTDLLLLEHVGNEHADATAEVVCPVCAAYPGGEPNHVIDDLAAHLMLEHRTSNNDLDVQLSGMRGAVRRMPHHGRSAANPRTRRAATNVQYQSSAGSTMMVLSPGERDRDPMDPIAELLSQLSSVRSRTAAAHSISTQLQQLEVQLHSTRMQADRLSAGQHPHHHHQQQHQSADQSARSVTTIMFPPVSEQVQSSAGTSTAAAATASRDRSSSSAFLLTNLDNRTMSEADQEVMETDQADKSLFVQELLLALLSDHTKLGEAVGDLAEEETLVKAAAAAPQTKPDLSAAAHTEPPRAATASSVNVDRVPAANAAVPRANRVPAAGSVPPMDGNRIVPNQSSAPGSSSRSAIVKRKPLPAATRTGKDSMPAAAGNKRH